MKYAGQVISLMESNPRTEFRMAQIVRYVLTAKRLPSSRRNAVREGIRRVLVQLREAGHVEYISEGSKTGFYIWRGRLPHAVVEKCHANCNNTGGQVAPVVFGPAN